MVYRIVSRVEAGLPAVVTNSTGTPRPPLANAPMTTVHYTGNNVVYRDADAAAVTRQIQAVFSATKPFEYNYVIGQRPDDQIIEYAGKFVAAHSAGENTISFGVLLLLGVGEKPTDLMIDKYRWLRDVLISSGHIRPNPDQRMHFQMPGAATACAGPTVTARWSEFLLPWTPVAAPVPVSPEEDEVSKPESVYIAKPPVGAPGNPPWFVVERFGGGVRYCVGEDAANPAIKQVHENKERYNHLHASVFGKPAYV
jgi:hypothetical protein